MPDNLATELTELVCVIFAEVIGLPVLVSEKRLLVFAEDGSTDVLGSDPEPVDCTDD